MTLFEILASLPPYASDERRFSASGKGLHTQGLVVRFTPSDAVEWHGAFAGGLEPFSGAYQHPDLRHVVVVSEGQSYVVDPLSRVASHTFGPDITGVAEVADHLVFSGRVACYVLTADGESWVTRRLSWDGIRCLGSEGPVVTGQAVALDGQRVPFTIDLTTRRASGGAY